MKKNKVIILAAILAFVLYKEWKKKKGTENESIQEDQENKEGDTNSNTSIREDKLKTFLKNNVTVSKTLTLPATIQKKTDDDTPKINVDEKFLLNDTYSLRSNANNNPLYQAKYFTGTSQKIASFPIRKGFEGENVKALQSALNANIYIHGGTPLKVDGIFGESTQTALRAETGNSQINEKQYNELLQKVRA